MKKFKLSLLFPLLFVASMLFADGVFRQTQAQYPQITPPKPEKTASSSLPPLSQTAPPTMPQSTAKQTSPSAGSSPLETGATETGVTETKPELQTEGYNAFREIYYTDKNPESESEKNSAEKKNIETSEESVVHERPVPQKESGKTVKDKPEDTATEKSDSKQTTVPEIAEATSAFNVRDYESAIEKLTVFYQKDKTQPPPGIFMAQFSANARQNDQVRQWLDKTTWDYPQDPEAFLLLADFAVQESRFMEARLLVDKGTALLENISQNSKRHQVLKRLSELIQGQLYQLRGNWEEAKIHLEKLNSIEPKNSDVLTRLGFVIVKLGKYKDALPYYQQAIDAGAPLPLPKLVVAQLLVQDGKEAEADTLFAEALKTPDITPLSLRVAAVVQIHRGHIAEAEKFLDQAMQAEPDNIENLNYAGMIALFKKDYSKAEELFAKAILLAPNHPTATNGLALALAEQPDPLKKERAIMYAKNHVQNSQQSPDSLATLAWVFFKSDQTNDAMYLMDPVLFSGEISPLNAYFLAEIAAATGQEEKAFSLVKAALQSKNYLMKQQEAEALKKQLEAELPTTTADVKAEEQPAVISETSNELSEDSALDKTGTSPLSAATSAEKPANAPKKLNSTDSNPTEASVPQPVLPLPLTPPVRSTPQQPSVKPENKPEAVKPEVQPQGTGQSPAASGSKPVVIPGTRSGTTGTVSPRSNIGGTTTRTSPTLAPPQKR